jgi:galactonate dehydratase
MISAANRRRALLPLAQLRSTSTKTGGPHPISELRAFAVRSATDPSTSYSVLQVRTESGLVGYGECKWISSSDLKAANQAITGRSASAYEALAPMVSPELRAGLDMALLDILGKATNAPVYRVLGGPTRNKARGIVRLSGKSDEELQQDLQKQLAVGFRAFLVPIPTPAARNQGSAFIQVGVARFKAMRAAAPDADFAFASGDQLTPSDTATLAAAVESMHPLWFDEPCPVSNLSTLQKVAGETVVPIGFGRDISAPGTFQDLLRQGLVDLLRPDLLTHGISGVRRLAAMAETYYVAVAPWHQAGPVATAATLHLAASIPNFFIAQLPSSGSAALRDGFFELPQGPGLGVNVDENELERNQIA